MKEQYKYKYSLIIPHFNVPDLLERCLSSIPERDDLQTIVVDDKSSVESVEHLKLLESRYPRVHFVYTKDNGGGGRARNIGLKEADGEYVLFSDSDDMFTPDISNILDDYKDCKKDIIFFNVKALDENLKDYPQTTHTLNTYIDMMDSNRNQSETLLRYMFGEPWCKIVRKEIIERNSICFDEIIVHNDTKFSYLVGHFAKTIAVDRRAGYLYFIREGSVSKKRGTLRDYAKIKVFGESWKFFKSNNIPVIEIRHWKALYNLIRHSTRAEYNKGIELFYEVGYLKNELYKEYSQFIVGFNRACAMQSILRAPDLRMKRYCIVELIKSLF